MTATTLQGMIREARLQPLSSDMEPDEVECADWQGGYDGLVALCHAMAKAVEECQVDWQPIDTAPRDGTRFMAFQKRDENQRYECWWQDDFGNWSGWQDDWDNEPNPTHWKPLDPEPETL